MCNYKNASAIDPTDEMPLVSVIMAVYNTRCKYLEDSINSILNQTYPCFEFIIVDDGSDDKDVTSFLDSAQKSDDRIKLITNTANIGLTRSLNIALDNCSGKYIARMDSDDISVCSRLEKQVEYMEVNPEVCQTGTNIISFNDNGDERDSSKDFRRISREEIRDVRLLFENTGYAHPTFMLRKSFLDEHNIRYRENIKKAQDYALTTDIILAGGKRHLIKEPLLRYRLHDGQISSNSYQQQVECQAQTAYRRLRATFESLSDDECWAIARMNHERQDYSPSTHICAINKMISENNRKKLFDEAILKEELYYEWYRKIMRISRIRKKPWGAFHILSLKIIPTVIRYKKENGEL